MSAGNFDCGLLLESKVKMDQVWADNQASSEYTAEVEALNTIIANQRGFQLMELTDPEKDRQVKVNWLSDCATDEVADCDDDCEIGGSEIGDNCKTYSLTICKHIDFKVAQKKYRTSIWSKEEVVAKAMLTKMKQLDEAIVEAVVSKLDTFTGTNAYLGAFTASNGSTVIPAVNWNPSLFAYFTQVAIRNRMRDAYMLSGSNLFEASQMVAWNSQNAEGKGAAAAFGSMQKYFDLFNIDSVLGENKTFLIRPTSVAFVSKAYNPSTPIEIKGKAAQMLYSVPSKNLQGVTYDVVYDTECVGDEIYDKWRIKFKGDLLQAPANCDGTNTGLLSFVCA